MNTNVANLGILALGTRDFSDDASKAETTVGIEKTTSHAECKRCEALQG